MEINEDKMCVEYMDEFGWFDDFVYSVWLNGCTDGWPRAIFVSEKDALKWAKTQHLNPEGYNIRRHKLENLAKEIVIYGEEK